MTLKMPLMRDEVKTILVVFLGRHIYYYYRFMIVYRLHSNKDIRLSFYFRLFLTSFTIPLKNMNNLFNKLYTSFSIIPTQY